MNEVFIASAVRTPIGSYGGVLSSFSAVQLASMALRAALEKSGINSHHVNEVFLGNVISANLGQAPAKQSALGAGIDNNVPCTLINKVCASGMKAIMLGAQSIMLGINEVVVAGGTESMSNVPFYIPKARFGYKYGNAELVDGLVQDGLWEVYHQFPMGNCAENTAKEMGFTREQQDDYAIKSYKRAAEATKSGFFKSEIIPLNVQQKKGDPIKIDEDEEFKNVDFGKIPTLKPVFDKDGTVTAANASTLNDGASALILISKKKLKELKIEPIARIVSFADASQEPIWFTTSPALAIPKALKNGKIDKKDIDYYEINEAFSVVALANNKLLDLDPERVNVFGGAVSLGHPLGCSGARITTTLINVLNQKKSKLGVAGICNGGGGASALVIENLRI